MKTRIAKVLVPLFIVGSIAAAGLEPVSAQVPSAATHKHVYKKICPKYTNVKYCTR